MKPLLDTYKRRNNQTVPPLWLMRQAGRYLPEYRQVREKAGGFLNLTYTPELASEVTVQPIRRYQMDGAILFSDILVVPHALGMDLRFEVGEGPLLPPLKQIKDLSFDQFDKILAPIGQTLEKTRIKLNQEGFEKTTLIGFCGAPWTVLCYMIDGRGKTGFPITQSYLSKNNKYLQEVTDILVDASIRYLSMQIDHGAEAIQIFDSWAGLLTDEAYFRQFTLEPTQKIVAALKKSYPDVPIIGFPRQAHNFLKPYTLETGIDVLALDENADLDKILRWCPDRIVLQGNLSNQKLLDGGVDMIDAASDLLNKMSGRSFVFNLGHGVIKETPPHHVADLVNHVRGQAT